MACFGRSPILPSRRNGLPSSLEDRSSLALKARLGPRQVPRSYVIVYHADRAADDPWLDIGNDPDLANPPMTWGICRTNVRGWVRQNDQIFFIATTGARDLGTRYFLSARLVVRRLLTPGAAVSEFRGRQNVIVDDAPPGTDAGERVRQYIHEWGSQLQWPDADRARKAAQTTPSTLGDYAIEIDGRLYIHAFWDPHDDWRSRLGSPYVVGDSRLSIRATTPIAWEEVHPRSAGLPPSAGLTNRSHRHAARRVAEPADIQLLSRLIESAGAAS